MIIRTVDDLREFLRSYPGSTRVLKSDPKNRYYHLLGLPDGMTFGVKQVEWKEFDETDNDTFVDGTGGFEALIL